MSPEFDVAVVGGGIVGASCAWECARAGQRVALIEAGLTGGGATSANMGQILTEYGSEAEFRLTQFSRRLWEDLQEELPGVGRVRPRGVAVDRRRTNRRCRRSRVARRAYARRGVRATVLDSSALAAEEPNLRRGLAGGLLTPDDLVIYPPTACDYLVDRAQARSERVCSEAERPEGWSARRFDWWTDLR